MKTSTLTNLRRHSSTLAVLLTGTLLSSQFAKAATFSELGVAHDFAVLAVNGNIVQTGPPPPVSAPYSPFTSLTNIDGAVGVAAAGFSYQGSGSVNDSGPFLVNTGSTFSTTSTGTTGSVIQNASVDAHLASARSDAYSAAAAFAALAPNVSYGTITQSTSLNFGPGRTVVNIAGINLGLGQTLSLNGVADTQLILNIAGAFNLLPGRSLVCNFDLCNVVYNVIGSGTVSLTGNANDGFPLVKGMILAPDRDFVLDAALVEGDVIGKSVSMKSGSSVVNADCAVPEPSSGIILGSLIGLFVLLSYGRQWIAKAGLAFAAR